MMCWRCGSEDLPRRFFRPWHRSTLCRRCGAEVGELLAKFTIAAFLLGGRQR